MGEHVIYKVGGGYCRPLIEPIGEASVSHHIQAGLHIHGVLNIRLDTQGRTSVLADAYATAHAGED